MGLVRAALTMLTGVLIACGDGSMSPTGSSGDGGEELALATVVPVGTTCGSGASAVYFIWGLSNSVRDPGVRPLEAVVPVGQTLRLTLDFEGCGGGTGEVWTSTHTEVGDLTPDERFSAVTHFTARAPGVTEVSVDFDGPDGKVHRTYPAYCPGSIYLCVPPRTPFTRVRVVAE